MAGGIVIDGDGRKGRGEMKGGHGREGQVPGVRAGLGLGVGMGRRGWRGPCRPEQGDDPMAVLQILDFVVEKVVDAQPLHIEHLWRGCICRAPRH